MSLLSYTSFCHRVGAVYMECLQLSFDYFMSDMCAIQEPTMCVGINLEGNGRVIIV